MVHNNSHSSSLTLPRAVVNPVTPPPVMAPLSPLPQHVLADFHQLAIYTTLYARHHAISLAPIQSASPEHILDIGAGVAFWSHEQAHHFPYARVVGIDMDTHIIAPNVQRVNCVLLARDYLEGLPFREGLFDLVHQHLFAPTLSAPQWFPLLSQMIHVTRPGGWLEMLFSSWQTDRPGPATHQFQHWQVEAARQNGGEPITIELLPRILHTYGLTSIATHKLDFPIGSWGGYIGHITAATLLHYAQKLKALIIRTLNVLPAVFDRVVDAMRQEWRYKQDTLTLHIICARRSLL